MDNFSYFEISTSFFQAPYFKPSKLTKCRGVLIRGNMVRERKFISYLKVYNIWIMKNIRNSICTFSALFNPNKTELFQSSFSWEGEGGGSI